MRCLLLLPLSACQSVSYSRSASHAEVVALVDRVATDGDTKLQVGDSHASHGVWSPSSWGMNVTVHDLAESCRRGGHPMTPDGTCLLDDPALHWTVMTPGRAPDLHKIISGALAVALPAALIYGNYECLGPGCGTAAEVAVITGDSLIGVALVGLVAFVAVELSIAAHD